jgi:adenylate cyclase class 2
MIEVEAKYLVANVGEFEQAALLWAGGNPALEYLQCDEYFNHPCRDFGQTDEAFRIRSCNGQTKLTYKGPRLDTVTKTREELELEIPSTESGRSDSVLRSLLSYCRKLCLSEG